MKRQWRIRRQPQPRPDAQRRWDRAYQLLAEWALTTPEATPAREATLPSSAGGAHANRDLCAGLDPATSASAGH